MEVIDARLYKTFSLLRWAVAIANIFSFPVATQGASIANDTFAFADLFPESNITAIPSLSSLNLVPIPINFRVAILHDHEHSRTLPLPNVFLSGLRSAADLSERPFHQQSHEYAFANTFVRYELDSLQDSESRIPYNNERASQIWTIGMAVTRIYETGYDKEAVAHASLGDHYLWHLSIDNIVPAGGGKGLRLPPSSTAATTSASAPASVIQPMAVQRRQSAAAANANNGTLSWMPPENFHLEHCEPTAGHVDARAALPLFMGYMMVYAAPLGPDTVIQHVDYRVRGLRLTFTAATRYHMEVRHTNWAVQELGRQYVDRQRSGGVECQMTFYGQVGSLTVGVV
ncbi:MAG: hypothetical protein Q9167_001420 [Letrouitia subvulpina]